VALGLIWRIISLGFSEYFSTDVATKNIDTVLKWNSSNSQALFSKSLSQLSSDTNFFTSSLTESIISNVSDSRGLVLLAEHWAEQGEVAKANKAMRLLGEMYPADAKVNIAVASYFYKNNNITEAFQHWSQAMTRSHHFDTILFEFIYSQLNNRDMRAAILDAAKQASKWWPRFFAFAIKQSNKHDIEIVDALYDARLDVKNSVEPAIRRQYIRYLVKRENWQKAYMVWLSGLSLTERESLGYLYDGGFENEFDHYGFYWHAYKNKAAKIDRVRSNVGASGNKALKVTFLNKPTAFHHVRQKTLLSAGRYLFKGKVKKDGLKSNRGVSWRISCGRKAVLGESTRFNGMEHWQSFEVEFKVPEQNCNMQDIWLVTKAKNKSDFKIKGSLWFDDLSIVKLH